MISIQVDVDNLWIYENEYGLQVMAPRELLFEQAMPLLLEKFEKYKVKATFFIIGKDLELSACKLFCLRAQQMGHEIGNHSYSHPTQLHRLSYNEKSKEIKKTHDLIAETVGKTPVGFRAPGYYIDDEILKILMDLQYLYDSSVLPSFLNPLMGYYIAKTSKQKIDKVFGRKRYGLVSQKVTRIEKSGQSIYEFPITTMPGLRLPIHSTFAYLGGKAYLHSSLFLLKNYFKNGIYLFHAIDTVDETQCIHLKGKIVPFKKSLGERLELIDKVLSTLSGSFVTAEEYVNRVKGRSSKSFLLSKPLKPYATMPS